MKDQEIRCPVCGGNRYEIGELTFHTYGVDGLDTEWMSSDYNDDDGYTIQVKCRDCQENDIDTDLTMLAVEAGWLIYDEDSLRPIAKEDYAKH